ATDGLINDSISVFYLPKQIYSLLDPTRNVHNKLGLSAEYSYHYRNYYSCGLDMNIFREIGSPYAQTTFYTAGIHLNIHDGLVQGISELGIYYNQYFTDKLFSISAHHENMILGIRLGLNITSVISIHMHRHDVFYDRNLDGITDLNSTQGFKLVARF
ncbi:uncharacterized protein METZ01_LOCUS475523, partial [marine metagenome]